MENVDKILAEFIKRLEFKDLPRDVIEKAKYHVLDTVGCILAGANTPPLDKIFAVVKKYGGSGSSTLIGRDFKSNCLNAVLFNGAAAHSYEFDDLHRSSVVHPGAVVIPAALTLAEALNADGKTVLLAIVTGYEVMTRVGMALGKSHYYFWHTTATAGVFGSAAACSKILGLSSESVLDALGNAGTQASGLWEFKSNGAMSKLLHTGRAAQSGMLSALLAEEGFTGAKSILEGEKGLLRATSKDYDFNKLTESLGETFKLFETSVKLYPSCGHTHPAIQAALKLLNREKFAFADIREVVIKTYSAALDVAGIENPLNPYQAKFSLAYCVATALREGKVELRHFTQEMLRDPVIKRFMSKIDVLIDPELDKAYPNKWLASVSITLNDGRKFEETAGYPEGNPGDPIWKQQVINKFVSLTSSFLEKSAIKEIVEKTLSLDKLENVNELMLLLSSSR